MWGSLLRLVGLSAGTDPDRDQYDPVHGLQRRAIEQWLERNPAIRDEYETDLRARAAGRGVTPRSPRTGPGRLRPEPVEQRGGETQGQEESAHVRDRRQDGSGGQGRVDADPL
jgi:hypothetical protein